MTDPITQVDQLTAVFGSQAALARAVGVDRRNVTEWRRRKTGIPPKHYEAIFRAADEIGKTAQLPIWFPRFERMRAS